MIIIQLPSRGIPDYCVFRLFLGFFWVFLSPYKSIAFHNTTKGGYSSAMIVIIIYYDQILYDNK